MNNEEATAFGRLGRLTMGKSPAPDRLVAASANEWTGKTQPSLHSLALAATGERQRREAPIVFQSSWSGLTPRRRKGFYPIRAVDSGTVKQREVKLLHRGARLR